MCDNQGPSVVTLDSNAAWRLAKRMVSHNRDMVVAIAGVFFVLPDLVKALLPMPQFHEGMTVQQASEAITRFYAGTPWLIGVIVVLSGLSMVGFLTVLTILLDRRRPTVREALGTGFRLLPTYLAAQVLIVIVLSFVWALLLGVFARVLPASVAPLAATMLMIYPVLRVVLVGPELVIRRVWNPIRGISGALACTRGHGAALALVFGPALGLFVVAYGLVMIVIETVLARLGTGEAPRLIGEAISVVLLAVGYSYFAAIVAATYQQLGAIPASGDAITP